MKETKENERARGLAASLLLAEADLGVGWRRSVGPARGAARRCAALRGSGRGGAGPRGPWLTRALVLWVLAHAHAGAASNRHANRHPNRHANRHAPRPSSAQLWPGRDAVARARARDALPR